MSERPCVVWHPGRMGGQPTIGHLRLTVACVCSRLVAGDPVDATAYDFALTRADVLTCAWWAVTQANKTWWNVHLMRSSRPVRDLWVQWADDHEMDLWHGLWDVILDPPLAGREDT